VGNDRCVVGRTENGGIKLNILKLAPLGVLVNKLITRRINRPAQIPVVIVFPSYCRGPVKAEAVEYLRLARLPLRIVIGEADVGLGAGERGRSVRCDICAKFLIRLNALAASTLRMSISNERPLSLLPNYNDSATILPLLSASISR
jgi:hypothetical protein